MGQEEKVQAIWRSLFRMQGLEIPKGMVKGLQIFGGIVYVT